MLDLSVLVVDDDKRLRRTVRACLETIGCNVLEAPSAPAMRGLLDEKRFDLTLLDLRLGSDDGLELLPVLTADGAMDVVIITGFASISSAVEAMRRGATDYLAKPFSPEQLRELVSRVAERRATDRRLGGERKRRSATGPEIHLVTESPLMLHALDLAARAAVSEHPALLVGEPGVGKAMLGRRMHALSTRGSGPFITADASDVRDVELLPVRCGAAAGGTLFVDGIDRLPPARHEALLHDAASGQVRVIGATTRDAPIDRFLSLHVPPLRQRSEDILPLARRALAFYCQGTPVPKAELTLEAENALVAYPWPRNVRELCEAMERAVILRSGVRVGIEALPQAIAAARAAGPRRGGQFTIDAIEREHIYRVLASGGSIDEASRLLGIDASTLWRKRKRYEEE